MKNDSVSVAFIGFILLSFSIWVISQECFDFPRVYPLEISISSVRFQPIPFSCQIAAIKPEQPELTPSYSLSPSALLSPIVASGTSLSASPSPSPEIPLSSV